MCCMKKIKLPWRVFFDMLKKELYFRKDSSFWGMLMRVKEGEAKNWKTLKFQHVERITSRTYPPNPSSPPLGASFSLRFRSFETWIRKATFKVRHLFTAPHSESPSSRSCKFSLSASLTNFVLLCLSGPVFPAARPNVNLIKSRLIKFNPIQFGKFDKILRLSVRARLNGGSAKEKFMANPLKFFLPSNRESRAERSQMQRKAEIIKWFRK